MKVKRCAHCGSADVKPIQHHKEPRCMVIECQDCYATGGVSLYEGGAVKAWNRRQWSEGFTTGAGRYALAIIGAGWLTFGLVCLAVVAVG